MTAAPAQKQPQATKKAIEVPAVFAAKLSAPAGLSTVPPQVKLPQYFAPNQSLDSTLGQLAAVWGRFSLDTKSIMAALNHRYIN